MKEVHETRQRARGTQLGSRGVGRGRVRGRGHGRGGQAGVLVNAMMLRGRGRGFRNAAAAPIAADNGGVEGWARGEY